MEGKIFLAGLTAFAKFGPRRLKKLEDYFSNWENAFKSSISDLHFAGIEDKIAQEFLKERKTINLEKIRETLQKEKINLISLNEQEYPRNLKQISDPPALLYIKGNLRSDLPLLAVVGARKNTPYGERAINSLLPSIISKNVGIVSGLAIGTDSRAHEEALKNNGYTIAVLGAGLDKKSIYPQINLTLAEKIINSGGAVISEFPPETPPLRQNFPLRNRIIAGISKGVLIIEAGLKSGSLITARLALEENREVLAVPGSIFSPQSEGPNNLIKQGAKPVASGEDVLEIFSEKEISSSLAKQKNAERDWSGFSEKERIILLNLSDDPISADELKEKAKLDIREINSTLSILEINGTIKNICGRYVIC
jgi:DNA processing protein